MNIYQSHYIIQASLMYRYHLLAERSDVLRHWQYLRRPQHGPVGSGDPSGTTTCPCSRPEPTRLFVGSAPGPRRRRSTRLVLSSGTSRWVAGFYDHARWQRSEAVRYCQCHSIALARREQQWNSRQCCWEGDVAGGLPAGRPCGDCIGHVRSCTAAEYLVHKDGGRMHLSLHRSDPMASVDIAP